MKVIYVRFEARDRTGDDPNQSFLIQMDLIKKVALNSILEALPTIIREITPKIIESAEEIIKKNIHEALPTTEDIFDHSLISTPTSDQVHHLNKAELNAKLKLRNVTHWKSTRSKKLAKLYTECLEEEPPYIPQKFRVKKEPNSSTAEIAVYSKLSVQKVTAEMELLNIKAQESQEKIKQLDNEAYHLFENEVDKNEVTEKLKTNWDNQAKKDETTVYRKWEKRIKE